MSLGTNEHVLANNETGIVVENAGGDDVHSLARVGVRCMSAAHAAECMLGPFTTRSSPDSHNRPPYLTTSCAAEPAPEVLRQREQWQMTTFECLPVISKRIPPHRQLPLSIVTNPQCSPKHRTSMALCMGCIHTEMLDFSCRRAMRGFGQHTIDRSCWERWMKTRQPCTAPSPRLVHIRLTRPSIRIPRALKRARILTIRELSGHGRLR